ncbi:MAG: exo-alpha-sialidase [Gemmatimonadaceae bacterium]|nr:exo-alpha-sialidase [Gemmatimonadaceae bacterium]
MNTGGAATLRSRRHRYRGREALRVFAALCALTAAAALACNGRRDADAGADAIQPLPSPAGPGAGESHLAVGGDGRIYLSWLEPSADSQVVLRFSALDGDKWSEPRDIHVARDFFINWADFPSLAVARDGRMAAHWLQRFKAPSSYTYDVRVAVSSDGGNSWGEPAPPHVDRSVSEKGFVTLWAEGDGFAAVWLDGRNADKAGHDPRQEMMLYMSPKVGSDPATEVRLDGLTCDCCQTTVAITSAGPIVAYRNRTAEEIRDIYYVRRVAGAWTEPRPIHDDGWHIEACPVNGPMIGARGDRVAIAWFTGANGVRRVNVAFSSDAGATFGAPIRTDEGNPEGRVALALLDDGSALVSWIERANDGAANVRARRVRQDRGAGPASTIAASSAARASGFPRMVVADGNAYFSWTAPGSPSEVRTARASVNAFR